MSDTQSGWRVALRLARREAQRRKGQTALMLVLICLPVLAVTASAVMWKTADVSSAESVERRMGAAEALVEATPSSQIAQFPDPDVALAHIGEVRDSGPAGEAELRAVLGEDRPLIPIQYAGYEFETDLGIGELHVVETDIADPLTEGLFRLVEGRYPAGPGQVVVNRALTDRGPGLGDPLTLLYLTDDGTTGRLELQIVGIAEHAGTRSYPYAAVTTGTLPVSEYATQHWLVGGDPVTWDDVLRLNEVGMSVASRHVLNDPPDISMPEELGYLSPGFDNVALTVLVLVFAMVLIEVVLLAGPAFAVRAKAQARTLALVTAVGGSPQQARRTVLASGVVIGVIGGLLGVALGIGVAWAGRPLAQTMAGQWFGPFEVPWLLVGVVAVFGLLSALLAAVVPAYAASRQDVVAVLAGRRGEGRPSARSPLLGLVLIGAGIAAATVGSQAGNDAAPALIGLSAIIAVIGMILIVPIVVTFVARIASHFPLAFRFAARDAARHRTRTVPAVAAVAATVAGVIALGIAIASMEAYDEKNYEMSLAHGHSIVQLYEDADEDAAMNVLTTRLRDAEITTVRGVPYLDNEVALTYTAGGREFSADSSTGIVASRYGVGTDVLEILALSESDRERARNALADDGFVILADRYSDLLESGQITVRATTYDDNMQPFDEREIVARGETIRIGEGWPPLATVLSPAVAEHLDLQVATVGLLITTPVDGAAEQDLSESLRMLPGSPYLYVERGYETDPAIRIVQMILAALGAVLMLGGTLTATFLALSDARPDLATMSAVGAKPRTRRGVAAAYALIVGFTGAVLGAPIGFIPGVAISRPMTRDWQTGETLLAVPWPLIGLVVIGLPLLTALAVGACARGRLPLAARVE